MSEEKPPAQSLHVPAIAAEAAAAAFQPTIQMKSSMWLHWGHIAVENEVRARKARSELVELWGSHPAGLMLPEMEAALAAVAAVAIALDAIHFEVAPMVGRDPDARTGSGKAWGYQLETLRQAFPEDAGSWQKEMEWLFDLRRQAIHPQPLSREPVPHPAVPTNVQYEFATFTYENARRAVDFLVRVYLAVFGTSAPVIAELVDMRSQ